MNLVFIFFETKIETLYVKRLWHNILKIMSKRGHVKIFNSPHNCMGTLRPLITETISK